MKKLLLIATSLLLLNSYIAKAQATTAPAIYGQAFSDDMKLSPGRLSWLMKDKNELNNFQMVGYVQEVCQKEGCWLKMTTNPTSDDAVLIKMKDHAFTVPKNINGKMIAAHGNIVKKTQSIEEQQHYLEDAGASAEAIKAITQPKEVYEMQASGVKVY